MSDDESATRPADPWTDLTAFASLPRVGGHWLSPDGRRVVVGLATRDTTRDRYVTALWDVDPTGDRPARRLTRSAQGESGAAFTPSGDLLFVSKRPDPDGDDDGGAALWLQPAAGGDARLLAGPPGGVRGVVVSAGGIVVAGVSMLPSATDFESDRVLRDERDDAKVTAILHEEFPVRYWDHDRGPAHTRLVVGDLTTADDRLTLRDLTGHVGSALDEDSSWDITPDGRTVVTTWTEPEPGGSQRTTLVAIDVETGERRVLATDAEHQYEQPRISPDGTQVACVVERLPTPEVPNDNWLGVLPVAGGDVRAVARDWDRMPGGPHWTPDGRSLIVTADHDGRCPVWRVDVESGAVMRLTGDHGAYDGIGVTPDGRWVHALRAAMDSAAEPVRIAVDGSGTVETLRGPAGTPTLPGTLTEVTTTGEDGTPVRAWLALPHGASAESPAPLLLKIHGGPVMSANTWAWRSCSWVFVARGYAVLMPDPALSTGYGVDFIRRGWTTWGDAPYTDLMRITDAAQARDDIDASRTGAMGASFGGYMANWIAGHTDRFAAIATHASVWDRNASIESNDMSFWFRRSLSHEAADAMSPHHFGDSITTPMLITHGGRDYRVPLSEGMKLWWALSSRAKTGNGSSPHKFLYFPDETHFIGSPNHSRLWHAAVTAFFDHHVLGKPWQRPDLLG
jgi:dipeptidyl aminopeptidase/acylaminoacyl peptidase